MKLYGEENQSDIAAQCGLSAVKIFREISRKKKIYNPEAESILWSNIFKHCIEAADYWGARDAVINNPDPTR
jgi:hypothetical protein